jgi:hypothetical protein
MTPILPTEKEIIASESLVILTPDVEYIPQNDIEIIDSYLELLLLINPTYELSGTVTTSVNGLITIDAPLLLQIKNTVISEVMGKYVCELDYVIGIVDAEIDVQLGSYLSDIFSLVRVKYENLDNVNSFYDSAMQSMGM